MYWKFLYLYSSTQLLHHSITAMETAFLGDSYLCSCGRSFPGPGPLNFHKRSCRSNKKRLHGALARAKEVWQERKRPRLDSRESEESGPSRNSDGRANAQCNATTSTTTMERGNSPEIVRSRVFHFTYASNFEPSHP